MFLIRKKWILVTACIALISGCAHRENSPPVVNVDPIAPDEAMLKRDWPQVAAMYPNGSVAAGPAEFNYEPKRNMPEWKYYCADSGTFFLNMALVPYNLVKHPQMEVVSTPGGAVRRTYNAQPVLP